MRNESIERSLTSHYIKQSISSAKLDPCHKDPQPYRNAMDSHSSQMSSPYKDPQMWESFTIHDVTNSCDQIRRTVSRSSLNSPQKDIPYMSSLPPCESSSSLSESYVLSPKDGFSPSDASLSPPLSHQRSRRAFAEATTNIGDRKARRRQQNRKSQRAFRDRKEAYQKYLEDRVDDLNQEHSRLAKSLTSQCKTVSRLRTMIGGLNSQIVSLQDALCRTLSSINLSQQPVHYQSEVWILEPLAGGVIHTPSAHEAQPMAIRPGTVANVIAV